ncbi:MAG: hypothetical protein LIO71_06390 [Ruminococcus sp.]|nr:hypothetical protein [Ruminococcus sp.]MCD7800699.1 hypothetical protein [Ruminococcus sp.]
METFKKYYQSVCDFFKSQKGVRLSVCLGLLGLLLILFSNGNGSDNNVSSTVSDTNLTTYSIEEYRIALESNLQELIKSVDGAGDTMVMITMASSEQNVYAQEVKEHSNSDGSSEYQNEYITISSNGDKSALVSSVQSPKVMGVVVLCKGGSKSSVKEDIYKVVSALTGVNSSSIFVGQLV